MILSYHYKLAKRPLENRWTQSGFLFRPPSNDGEESAEDPDDLDDSHTEETFHLII